MNLQEVKRNVRALTPEQLVKLDAWLHGLIDTAKRTSGYEGAGKLPTDHKTYRSEMVSCGKKGCKCFKGELHGPYWYAYWTEYGKTRSQYIGKRLPKGIKPVRDAKAGGVR
jgi:hypothetical protein